MKAKIVPTAREGGTIIGGICFSTLVFFLDCQEGAFVTKQTTTLQQANNTDSKHLGFVWCFCLLVSTRFIIILENEIVIFQATHAKIQEICGLVRENRLGSR